MPQFYYDILFSLMFAIIVLILTRFRNTVFGRDEAAYRRIVVGLFSFMGLFLFQFAAHQGLFARVTFLGELAGQQMVEAIMVVAGLIFLLSGIGTWLPSLAHWRDNRRQLNKRYYCLKMINEVLGQNRDLDETYDRISSCLSSYLGFKRCAVYKYSSPKSTMYLSGAIGFDEGPQRTPSQIPIIDSELKTALNRFRATIATNTLPEWNGPLGPDLVMPIVHNNRMYGTYFCWVGDNIRIDDDLLDFASIIGSMAGKHTCAHVDNVRQDYYRSQQTSYERLNAICNRVSSVTELLPQFFKVVKDSIGVEYLSIASLDNSGENMVRYTIGSGGRVLLEKGVSRQTRGTDIFEIFESGQARIEDAITPNDKSGETDGLFLSCGMHSKIACPIEAGNRVVGVMTLGHTRPKFFRPHHLHRLGGLTDVIAGVIQREQLNRNLEIKEDHLLRLQLMQRQMLNNPPAQAFFDDACELLTRRMNCTVARISLLDRDCNHLVSQACRSIRPTGNDLQENEAIPLSLLPWHRVTLEAQKLMLINQDDPESRMPPQESTSALIPNIKSAMLVPIMMDDKVRGVISVGEARNWNRRTFNAADLIFAKDLAAKCALALKMKKFEIETEQSREECRRLMMSGDEVLPEFRNRLKSPLTSIIGAVELLRRKGASDDFSTRYYDMIMKSADRIKSMTGDDLEMVAQADKIEPEQVIG